MQDHWALFPAGRLAADMQPFSTYLAPTATFHGQDPALVTQHR